MTAERLSVPNWRGYAEELDELEDEAAAAQEGKRDIYKGVRELHGKEYADALKAAMRIRRMKAEKRERAEKVEGLAHEILTAINEPRAPRATSAREAEPDRGPEAERIAGDTSPPADRSSGRASAPEPSAKDAGPIPPAFDKRPSSHAGHA